ncbi:MAG: glycosyltransferase family 87 protein [Syntrophobacteraceae bacterium]
MKYRQFRLLVNASCLAGLVIWTLVTLFKSATLLDKPVAQDYGLNLLLSVEVIERHSFPFAFLYPLPSILLRYYLFRIGGDFSGLIWVGAMAFSMYFIMRFLVQEFYTGETDLRYIYAMLAFLPVAYYVQWDMRALNCNLIVLCLVLASAFYMKKESFFVSALFLSLGVALKLYPVLILAYFLIRKRYRLVLYAVFWIAALFVLIPVMALGVPGFIELTGKWVESVASTGAPDFLVRLVAYKTSLHFAVLSLMSKGDLAALSTPSLHDIKLFILSLQIFFIICAVIYLVFDLRTPSPKGVDHDLFSIILILLWSLLFSEQLQPHHGVFLLAASALIINFSLFGNYPGSVRYPVLAMAVLPSLVLKAASPGMEKAFAMNFQIVLYLFVLVFLRFHMAGRRAVSRGWASE